MNLAAVQDAIRAEGQDGWLFFDHHRRDPLAYKILGLSQDLQPTRRWYYLIPAHGEPRKLVHAIEGRFLDGLPGASRCYSRWSEQNRGLAWLLSGCKTVAMQFSERCAIPYVAMVDGGTIDAVRALKVKVRTSANLIQLFEARWTDSQLESHLEAGRRMDEIRAEAFNYVRDCLRAGTLVTEWSLYGFLRNRFSEHNLVNDHGPIVAVNANASDPHYEPDSGSDRPIETGDVVLLDMWAKLDQPGAVYYDITWTGYCGRTVPEDIRKVFRIVTGARDRGIKTVKDRAFSGLQGFEVDDEVREFINRKGYEEYFIHRTGHSIGENVHGSGANMDNYETHDERQIIPGTCFSIEPGIYLPHYGIRSEVNVYVGSDFVRVTGEIQKQLVVID